MSHGSGEGKHRDGTLIYTSDDQTIASNEILQQFHGDQCPGLKGKPKIFLFQVCLRVLLGFTGFYLVLPGITRFYLVLPGITRFYLVLLGFSWFYRVLLGFTGFYIVLLGYT